jgi:DHA2 family multidrug resistance protein
MMDWRVPDFDFGIPHAVALLEGEVSRQALMAAYVQSFHIVFIASVVMAPFAILLRVRRPTS